jgi:protein-disulfide isomerase
MIRMSRRFAAAGFVAITLAACGPAGGEDNNTTGGTASVEGAALGDMVKGDADAPIEIIEYASWTCPACLDFHLNVVPTIQAEYIDTGKARFIFREFPTAPANIAVAGFVLSRCAGEDKYFDVLDELFERQQGILSVARQGDQVRGALEQVASNHGLVGSAQFDACLQDQSIRRAIGDIVDAGSRKGVNSTPTVFVNGERLQGFEWRTADGMRAVLNETLGESAPAEEAATE